MGLSIGRKSGESRGSSCELQEEQGEKWARMSGVAVCRSMIRAREGVKENGRI
jgi:hypothetical protein